MTPYALQRIKNIREYFDTRWRHAVWIAYEITYEVERNTYVNVPALAKRLRVDTSYINRILRRLEKARIVCRSKTTGRGTLWTLTDHKGNPLFNFPNQRPRKNIANKPGRICSSIKNRQSKGETPQTARSIFTPQEGEEKKAHKVWERKPKRECKHIWELDLVLDKRKGYKIKKGYPYWRDLMKWTRWKLHLAGIDDRNVWVAAGKVVSWLALKIGASVEMALKIVDRVVKACLEGYRTVKRIAWRIKKMYWSPYRKKGKPVPRYYKQVSPVELHGGPVPLKAVIASIPIAQPEQPSEPPPPPPTPDYLKAPRGLSRLEAYLHHLHDRRQYYTQGQTEPKPKPNPVQAIKIEMPGSRWNPNDPRVKQEQEEAFRRYNELRRRYREAEERAKQAQLTP
jgi:DNA-binding MarR family transcriptional regulator